MDRMSLLKELTEAHGPSGYEGPVREVLRRYLPGKAKVYTDNLGSLIAERPADEGPKVVLAGHMDEIGFMVTSVTDEGFLRFLPLGGWWEQVMLAQRVVVKGRKGDLTGVVGSKPPHILDEEERKKAVKKEEMFIDIGAGSKEEALKHVRPGDPVVPVCPFGRMADPKYLLAKAWDDRVGCAIFTEVLYRLPERTPNRVIAAGTVQEEVGLRGAQTSAFAVKPDIAFALEVGIAGDTPGIKEHEALQKLGKGPSILLYDASMIPNLRLRDLVIDTAEEMGIPYQFDSMPRGGTDAGRMHLTAEGVPSLVIGVPCRYIHSAVGVIHEDDYDNAVRLMEGVILKLDQDTVDDIKGK